MANAMKNMDVGDIRPRQVGDDSDIHMINQEVKIDTNQASTSSSHDDDQNQIKLVEAINSQYSNLLA